ncbi:MAG TPA: hypothetical protein VFY39_15555 [Gammaproteobacteria bacterium]|nr:hypothetical protein [Gammaproteobacteria bacterium]
MTPQENEMLAMLLDRLKGSPAEQQEVGDTAADEVGFSDEELF